MVKIYEFFKKNYVVIIGGFVILVALSGTGILGIQTYKARRAFAETRERIVELEEVIERAKERIDSLGEISYKLREDNNELERQLGILEGQYLDLRGYYNSVRVGNSELEKSNTTSISIVRECLAILREGPQDE